MIYAYPTTIAGENGMTLRDYFAGQAMAGLMHDLVNDDDITWEDGARVCYFVADAMLAERAKE